MKTPELVNRFYNHNYRMWYGDFKCECGKIFETSIYKVESGHTKSCGCYQKKKISESRATHRMSETKIFRIWNSMIQRCTNSNDKNYKNYGKRGIKVCERWLKFENFYEDMGEPEEGMSLDRTDNDGNYCPENCKWSTRKEQQRNQRTNKYLTINGETKILAEWAEISGTKYNTIQSRLRYGWTSEESVYGK